MSRDCTDSTGMPAPIALVGLCFALALTTIASAFYDELLCWAENNRPDDGYFSLKFCIPYPVKMSIGILTERFSWDLRFIGCESCFERVSFKLVDGALEEVFIGLADC